MVGSRRAADGERRRRRRVLLRGHGLRPVLGRLIDASDDGPKAEGAAVLTYRFWTTAFQSDPSVIGKTIRLDRRVATVVGVLEPMVPYPQETEIIANVVTSPHHVDATMVDGARASDDGALRRAGTGRNPRKRTCRVRTAHGAMVREHPEDYPPRPDFRIDAVSCATRSFRRLRTILLVLLAASALVFVDRLLERCEPYPRALGAARG